MALCSGLSGWAGSRKAKPIWVYWSKRQWLAVAAAGPYANLHLAQTHNHASTPSLSFLQARCPSCHPTNSVKALKCVQSFRNWHTLYTPGSLWSCGSTHMMTWLITMGSGGISRGPSRVGISENFIREHSRICCWQKHIRPMPTTPTDTRQRNSCCKVSCVFCFVFFRCNVEAVMKHTPAFLCCSNPTCVGVLRPSLALCHHPCTGSAVKSLYKNVPFILYTRTLVDCLTLMFSLQLN